MTASTDIEQAVAKSKWSWVGHTARMTDLQGHHVGPQNRQAS